MNSRAHVMGPTKLGAQAHKAANLRNEHNMGIGRVYCRLPSALLITKSESITDIIYVRMIENVSSLILYIMPKNSLV